MAAVVVPELEAGEEVDEEAMMAAMGFGGFTTTAGKHVKVRLHGRVVALLPLAPFAASACRHRPRRSAPRLTFSAPVAAAHPTGQGNGGAVTTAKKLGQKDRRYRQYMNRKGGFNRSLDNVQ